MDCFTEEVEDLKHGRQHLSVFPVVCAGLYDHESEDDDHEDQTSILFTHTKPSFVQPS